ncbi:hypothetical protein P691DRAFT_813350 [Macrolepiota fuliginosa MF-IS2]|uniref:Uncharacterized protein n=1 Tax=Macrolepiota fuliginosa MF-IS2 TaxID=1400762 RepID=A0A9P5XEW9_9AGAR|nr:hypothetical protein P691DRAFT_813350 [Macrolepiota fuliginosa MF-IS2]
MELKWVPGSPDLVDEGSNIHYFALHTCWIACPRVQGPYVANVLAELRLFPFCHLDSGPYMFPDTIYWLEQVSQDPLFVRQAAESDEDRLILAKYEEKGGIVYPEPAFDDIRSFQCAECWTLHYRMTKPLNMRPQKCIFMGSGGRTSFVILSSSRS